MKRPSPVVRREAPSELPLWLADLEFVARLAGDRATAAYDATFWTYAAGVAESLGILAATPRFDRDHATTGLRMLTKLATDLPAPLAPGLRTQAVLLNLLPPVAPLGPGTPFAAAALGHARPFVRALTRRTSAEQLAAAVTGASALLRVYCLAAPARSFGVTEAAGLPPSPRARSGRGPPWPHRAIRRGCRLSPARARTGERERG